MSHSPLTAVEIGDDSRVTHGGTWCDCHLLDIMTDNIGTGTVLTNQPCGQPAVPHRDVKHRPQRRLTGLSRVFVLSPWLHVCHLTTKINLCSRDACCPLIYTRIKVVITEGKYVKDCYLSK